MTVLSAEPVVLDAATVRTVLFTERRKGGYDREEVDAFRDDVCASLAFLHDRVTELSAASNEATGTQDVVSELTLELERVHGELTSEKEASRVALEAAAGSLAEASDELTRMAAELAAAHEVAGVSDAVELLASAQQTAAETILRASNAAESVRAQAEDYSANLHREADQYAQTLRAQAEADLAALRDQAAELRRVEADHRTRATAVLQAAIEFIKEPLVESGAGDAEPGQDPGAVFDNGQQDSHGEGDY